MKNYRHVTPQHRQSCWCCSSQGLDGSAPDFHLECWKMTRTCVDTNITCVCIYICKVLWISSCVYIYTLYIYIYILYIHIYIYIDIGDTNANIERMCNDMSYIYLGSGEIRAPWDNHGTAACATTPLLPNVHWSVGKYIGMFLYLNSNLGTILAFQDCS